VAHEQQPTAAGTFEVLDVGRVGDVLGVEAGALVGDVDLEEVGADAVGNADLLVAVI